MTFVDVVLVVAGLGLGLARMLALPKWRGFPNDGLWVDEICGTDVCRVWEKYPCWGWGARAWAL